MTEDQNMVEDIGKIISNGYGTYSRNLNICIPFVLSFFITILIAFLVTILGIIFILGPSLSGIDKESSPEALASQILPLISQHIFEIGILLIIIFLLLILVQAYFNSGAIGMAIQATGSGKSRFRDMTEAGKKYFFNMFLAETLFFLITLAGIVFIVPGGMNIDFSTIFISEYTNDKALFFVGIILWFIYLLLMSIILAVFRYALVADSIGPLESITVSLGFFRKNKWEVISLFVIIIFVTIAFFIIDRIMGSIPIVNILWSFINAIISLIVIPPLTTIWWVRLYMTRTDKKIYFNELLAHPNDLEKTESF